MRHVKPVLLIAVTSAVMLAACSDDSSVPGLSSGDNPYPTIQLTLEEADQVAETFLDAWRKADYASMYGLISPNSRDAYMEEAFVSEYETAAELMTLNTLDTQIASSLRQGTTAAIMYDVTFHTELFGDIPDGDRIMRLIETPEGWRVAWSRMDIFDALAEGARLELRRTMPGRGNIYDRNGQVLVDQNGRAVLLYPVQQEMPNVEDCISQLSRILRREYGDLEDQFAKFLPETRFLVGEIDPETYQVEEQILQEVCAIGDDPNDTGVRTTRRYFGELAPHVVGYVSQIRPEQVDEYERRGYPPDALIGQEGIEQAFEEYLAGKIGGRLEIIAPTGETLRVVAEVPAEPGQGVYLTIDRDLQAAVQQAFIEAYNVAQPTWATTSRGAAAVVMDVKTGEILAMVSYPWFDPSLFNPDSPVLNRGDEIAALRSDFRTPLLNRATMGKYPAGSVFKIVSMAAGLDSGVYNENTAITCNGRWYGEQFGDVLPYRTDWLPTGHGYVNFPLALTYSCDPYFWQLGVALHNADPQMLTGYAYRMGLGVATGQDDLPEEVGQIPNEELVFRLDARSWTIADTLNLVIGQGQLQITPLQITRMVAAIANGGTLYKPQFVKKVQLLGEEPVYSAQPTAISTLDFDPHTFELIQNSMCNVTLDPNGTARYIFDEWYDFQGTDVVVCGKTGTAQTGGETTRPQAWFVAFAPQDDPEIAVTVIVENSCEGSEVSAPIVRRIVEDYYGMPHSIWPPLWESGCIDLGE
ncbi:MAG: hypothetical protein JXJ20_01435 [Anaerolineae bacterium]|nr:hypothetical protein [Anaerolineae bacterium]